MCHNLVIKIVRFGSILPIFFAGLSAAFSQTPTPTPPVVDKDEVIKVESRLVIVPVSVLDANSQPVLGLTVKDFRVLEENRLQEIAQVSDAEKVPLEIALLFDISASTDPMFKFEQETAAKFLREVMRLDDRATIFTIGTDARIVQARDTAERAAAAVRSIQPTKEQTAFYDSILVAADHLRKNTPEGRRKVIVVISDGEDTNSKGVLNAIWNAERTFMQESLTREKLRELRVRARDDAALKEQNKVLQALQNADAVFYSINPGGSSIQLNKMSQFGQSNMKRFADETGGSAFLPKFLPIDTKREYEDSKNTRKNTETLELIFRQLANELRAQYLVQYYSDGEFTQDRYVRLEVGLPSQRNLSLRARQGYFVKN